MLEGVFEFVKGGNASMLECDKRVYAYASNELLQLRGKCNLIVEVQQTRKSLNVEFYICLLYTSPSPRDLSTSRMPSSA